MLQKLVLLSLAAISIARPDGAPICDVDKFDTSKHGGATSDLKYDIAVTPQGNKATIAINDQFIGLLLYVSDASGKHVGSLQPSSGDFKIATDCGGQSTITHSSSASKSGKFEWSGTETGPLTVNAIVMKDQKVWNIFKVPFQIGSAAQSQSSPPPKETEEVPVNTEPKVGIALQENDGPKNVPEETQVPKPAETPIEILPQESRPADNPQIILTVTPTETPTETPTVIEEPKQVPPVNNEPYHTQEQEPIAVPQASSPVQENPYAESNPPKKTYPKRKNYKRKNYKKKNYKKKNYKKKKKNSSSNDSSKGKHSSSAKKPCPKTYNKNKQSGMNPAYLKQY